MQLFLSPIRRSLPPCVWVFGSEAPFRIHHVAGRVQVDRGDVQRLMDISDVVRKQAKRFLLASDVKGLRARFISQHGKCVGAAGGVM
jgi:hypothetical protein